MFANGPLELERQLVGLDRTVCAMGNLVANGAAVDEKLACDAARRQNARLGSLSVELLARNIGILRDQAAPAARCIISHIKVDRDDGAEEEHHDTQHVPS